MPTQPPRQNGTPGQVGRSREEQVVEIWRAPGFESIEMHCGSAITQEYPRHWHDELYLCAIVDGGAHLSCVGDSYSTPPGSLVLIPPGEIHANRKQECTFRCMFVEFTALHKGLEQFVEQAIPGLNFRTELIDEKQALTSFLELYGLLAGSRSRLKCDTAVSLFFHSLVGRRGVAEISSIRDGEEDCAVRKVRRFLDERYAESISLQDLARLAGLSPYYLHRSFCRKVGMPPHAYQVQVRVAHARSYLRRGRSISDAASSVGFADQSHFSRHFKKLTGITPGQYLRLGQERTRRASSPTIDSLG